AGYRLATGNNRAVTFPRETIGLRTPDPSLRAVDQDQKGAHIVAHFEYADPGGRRMKKFTFFFSSRRRHTRWPRDWSSDVCSSDLRRLQFTKPIIIFLNKRMYVFIQGWINATY